MQFLPNNVAAEFNQYSDFLAPQKLISFRERPSTMGFTLNHVEGRSQKVFNSCGAKMSD